MLRGLSPPRSCDAICGYRRGNRPFWCLSTTWSLRRARTLTTGASIDGYQVACPYSGLLRKAVLIGRYPDQSRTRRMNIRHTPDTVAAPFGPYSHAVEVPEGSRLLYISGEVGVLPDGTVPEGIEAQAEACWWNVIAILADAGMGVGDLVKITTYLVQPEDVAAAGAARAKHFGDARPGSATIIVKALVAPEWLIEIEAVAAAKA